MSLGKYLQLYQFTSNYWVLSPGMYHNPLNRSVSQWQQSRRPIPINTTRSPLSYQILYQPLNFFSITDIWLLTPVCLYIYLNRLGPLQNIEQIANLVKPFGNYLDWKIKVFKDNPHKTEFYRQVSRFRLNFTAISVEVKPEGFNRQKKYCYKL